MASLCNNTQSCEFPQWMKDGDTVRRRDGHVLRGWEPFKEGMHTNIKVPSSGQIGIYGFSKQGNNLRGNP